MLIRVLKFMLLLLLISAVDCAPVLARGTLTALAGLRYAEYHAEEDGTDVTDADSFSQQYSILYQKAEKIANGRAGEYDLSIGYEWTGVDNEINSTVLGVSRDSSIRTGKILWNGNLLLAPGGLPFRFNLYSGDMHRTRLLENKLLAHGNNDQIRSSTLLSPDIVENIEDGRRIETGGTLIVGIRNGHYLGRYRDILSQFPRVLIDYRELQVIDDKSLTPQDYVERDLAFVSLNKKDNWFHYRMHQFEDHFTQNRNFTESTFMLGTIDHQLMRQWINITNWIKVSTDGSYTETSYFKDAVRNVKRFDINLFSTFNRSNWKAANFSNFYRSTNDAGELKKELEIPVFANGNFDRNTSWRFNFIGSQYLTELLQAPDSLRERDNVYLKGQIVAMQQSRFIVSPQFELEALRGDYNEGNAARATLELKSNRAYRPKYDLFGSYSIAYFNGDLTNGDPVDFIENEAVGSIETDLNQSLRVGFREDLLLGTGDLAGTPTQRMQPKSSLSLNSSVNAQMQRSGTVWRSTSTFFYEHMTRWRLKQRGDLTFDYLNEDGKAISQTTLHHSLRFDGRTLNISMENDLAFGDDIQTGQVNSDLLGTTESNSTDFTYNHRTKVAYSPSRNYEAEIRADYNFWQLTNGATNERLLVEQTGKYKIYKVNGVVRLLAELFEEADYDTAELIAGRQSVVTFSLGGNWYPTRHILLGGKISYRNFDPQGDSEFSYDLKTGWHYKKISVDLNYAYGVRDGGGNAISLADRNEYRWSVDVNKIF